MSCILIFFNQLIEKEIIMTETENQDQYLVSNSKGFSQLFAAIEVKPNHPITTLNRSEWHVIKWVKIEDGRLYVRSEDSCWFNLSQCDVRPMGKFGPCPGLQLDPQDMFNEKITRYRVSQNGKRCSEYQIKTWDKDTFDTLKEAIAFAHHWAYPKIHPDNIKNKMEVGKDYDMSMTESPVLMRIDIVKFDKNNNEIQIGYPPKQRHPTDEEMNEVARNTENL